MRISEGNHESIVDASNRCYTEYQYFTGLSLFELNRLQGNYYSELHTLQEEFNRLMYELREELQQAKQGQLSQTA
ncbi:MULTISPECIES: hypothetical protein [Paenibacillus]|jgi:hypothetical protein|uniref:Uncharacterized protein n=1 Tax=Paenibacillus baimaensis TaxID=2982185 RepID=A0ABT2UQF2_9BACL|nr:MULTISPECIES: hypothetical protein [unclassified Paenibacillus]MCU6796893.1 hypothetical protein [Paenibacillus sp. WQ 127069]OMF07279.1 hypothetical protein BK127_29760 [Paenibacillus sp. FSL H7-0331]